MMLTLAPRSRARPALVRLSSPLLSRKEVGLATGPCTCCCAPAVRRLAEHMAALHNSARHTGQPLPGVDWPSGRLVGPDVGEGQGSGPHGVHAYRNYTLQTYTIMGFSSLVPRMLGRAQSATAAKTQPSAFASRCQPSQPHLRPSRHWKNVWDFQASSVWLGTTQSCEQLKYTSNELSVPAMGYVDCKAVTSIGLISFTCGSLASWRGRSSGQTVCNCQRVTVTTP